jgi:Flp pilus assembly protein TadG/uncharacterized protein YegL
MFARAADIFKHGTKNLCRRFVTDRAGNLAMSFAIVSVPLLGAMGVSFDYVRALNLHREIQGNLDAALVATVKDIGTKDDKALKEQLANWLVAEAQVAGSYTLDTSSIVIDRAGGAVTARVKANVATTFMRVLGRETVPVSVQASVVNGKDIDVKNPFSMYLVLDRSGSMEWPTESKYTTTCYLNEWNKTGPYSCTKTYSKIESLKLAVASMGTQFTEIDPGEKYIRLGAVSYNFEAQSPTPLAWGVKSAVNYVQNLIAKDGTSSTDAFKIAYKALHPSDENNIHEKKNGEKDPGKYIVFMTDGDNNDPNDDTKTKKLCDDAKKKKITIYSIAFMAPNKGKSLLQYCATSTDHYFTAENTAGLVAAFKKIAEDSSKTPLRLTN